MKGAAAVRSVALRLPPESGGAGVDSKADVHGLMPR
jgi:hypothetical protein